MPFNATDPNSVEAAEKAGLDKSREISEALLRLLAKDLAALASNKPDNDKPGNEPAPGEYPSDIDPNITNEQHDLYKELAAEYEKAGAAPDVAKAAAFDHATRGLGAEQSEDIANAHEQITNRFLGKEALTDTTPAQNSREPLSFMQTMTASGVDASVAMAINKLHNQTCQYARDVMANQYNHLDKPAEDALSTAITDSIDDSQLASTLIDRHNADVRDIFIGVPKGEFQPELTAENHGERLMGLGLSKRDAERLTLVRDKEIFDAIALATNYPQNGESGSGDLFRAAVEDSLLDKGAKEAIVYNFDEDLAAAREQSIYEANEKAARMQRFAEYKSQSTDLTGAAREALLQGEAISTVYSMVLEDPSSDNTIEQATQVLEEAQNELKALVKESAALSLDPISDSTATRQNITASYEATLKESGATDKTAQKAAQDLSAGKGAEHSPSVRQAHREVLAHAHLRGMYERVYGSLNVPPSVAQPAAKDAARGLGANTSQNIATAHRLARISETVAPNLGTHDLTQYVNQFRSEKAAKYPGDNTEPTAHTLLKGAAMVALENGEPTENVISMVEKSPLNNPPGSNKADQAKEIVANVSQVMQAKAKRRVQDKSVSKAKGTSKKAGIEM